MTSEYILGVDGGGSKTCARLVHLPSGKSWQSRKGASSLSLGVSRSVSIIMELARELAQQAGCSLSQVNAVCGLAGAGESTLVEQALAELSPHFSKIDIVTDAKTSAFGANNGQAVAVVALGTGSVAMVLDADGYETMIGGWGTLVGDEGGGARLGVEAVKALLWELDLQGAAHTETAKYVASILGQNRSQILQWLRQASPTDFAALVPEILQRKKQCHLAQQLFAHHVQAAERLIEACGDVLPVVLVGGLAEITRPHLNSKLSGQLVNAKGTSLDGACLLAQQQSGQPLINCEVA